MSFRNTDDFIERLKAAFTRLTLLLSLVCVFAAALPAMDEPSPAAGTIISNRPEASYEDENGANYNTVSPVVRITVAADPAVNVTPDEAATSETVAPGKRVVRRSRICNTGNAEDFFLPVRADISAPATIDKIYFDTDDSGTIDETDTIVRINRTLTPRLAPGACQTFYSPLTRTTPPPARRFP